MKIPTEDDAIRIVEDLTGEKVKSIKRFPTGKANYVYDALTEKRQLVVRLTKEDSIRYFEGAIYWYPLLTERGVPLPKLIYHEIDPIKHGFPVMVMDRVPGKDLGEVYRTLTKEQKQNLAAQIASFQIKVQEMPLGPGFGYARSYEDPKLKKSYTDVVRAHLERSRSRITNEEIIGHGLIGKAEKIIDKYEGYFSKILPIPFLDDTTTKNVIIDQGKLAGVVDADFVCFGDIVQLVGLINMALLADKFNTDYVDYLIKELGLNDEQRNTLNLYTLLYGIDFLTNHGHAFNKDSKINMDFDQIFHLKKIIDTHLALL